jgi:hypothetical protein
MQTLYLSNHNFLGTAGVRQDWNRNCKHILQLFQRRSDLKNTYEGTILPECNQFDTPNLVKIDLTAQGDIFLVFDLETKIYYPYLVMGNSQ